MRDWGSGFRVRDSGIPDPRAAASARRLTGRDRTHIFENNEMTRPHPDGSALLPAMVAASKAMGHPTRLRILAMLRSGSLCVCQLTAVLHLAASTVSGHLAELRRAGLVSERKQGKWVEYRLGDQGPAAALLAPVLTLLAQDAQGRQDADTVRALRTVPRETLCLVGLDLDAAGVTRLLSRRKATGRGTGKP